MATPLIMARRELLGRGLGEKNIACDNFLVPLLHEKEKKNSYSLTNTHTQNKITILNNSVAS